MNLLPLPLLSSMLSLTLLCGLVAAPVRGQELEQEAGPDLRNRVVVVENVRYDYAQVLNVEPVFQILRATRTEEHCEPVSTRTLDPVHVVVDDEEKGRLGRLWNSVRRMFGAEEAAATVAETATEAEVVRRDALLTRNCKVVEVGREFRRPIAYDVDYVYRGTKYRSRLPDDPGNRLRIRVSVTPHIAGAEQPSVSAN